MTPAPMAGRVDRDGSRSNPGSGRAPRGERESAPAAYDSVDGHASTTTTTSPRTTSDSGLHINVTRLI